MISKLISLVFSDNICSLLGYFMLFAYFELSYLIQCDMQTVMAYLCSQKKFLPVIQSVKPLTVTMTGLLLNTVNSLLFPHSTKGVIDLPNWFQSLS